MTTQSTIFPNSHSSILVLVFNSGGQQVILDFAGKDATDQFYSLHRHSVIQKYQRLKVASLKHASPKIINTQFVDYSLVPFAEHPSLRFKYSPYYSDKHQQYRSIVRKFVADHVLEDALSCEESGKRPSKELVKLLGKEGYLAARLGPGKHLEGLKLPGNILPQEFDYFYEQITHEEYVRCMCRGYVDGFGGGMTIGLPPVFNYGKKELKERVMKEVLSGEKEICLAISEAFAGTFIITLGSDVSGIRTFAKKSADGSHFIVNGSKKWITGGMYADYFSTACKTEKGMTMLLIERGPGVETTPIKTSYSATAGTAYVVFENVKVPISNVLGVEDKGFAVVMANFNHERYLILT